MKILSIFLVLFISFGPRFHCQTGNTRTHNGGGVDSCLPFVRDYLVKNKIGGESLVLPHKAHDSRMNICYNGESENMSSCCSHKLEQRFRHSVDDEIHKLIVKKNSELRNLIGRNIAVYQDEIVTMIKAAEQKTQHLFTSTYHMNNKAQTADLSRFFSDLIDVYDRPDGSVRVYASTSRFFNQLFPLVFHNILNDPSSVELTDDYKKCLIRARNEVQPSPFGHAPQKLSTELSQAVALSHLFLSSLRTAVETLNATDSILLDNHCVRALVKMQHCSICQMEEAKPCRNLCLNVMRGCLVQLQHMEDPWNRFVDSVSLFNAQDGVMSVSTQHKAFQAIHMRISEAIMHAMETTHKFYNKVTAKCGNPRTPKGEPAPRPNPPVSDVTAPPADLHEQGRLLRQFLFTGLTESKGIYGNLADGLCDEKEFAAPVSHGRCWNGRAVAAYEETVKGKSVEDQAANPEVRVKTQPDPAMLELIQKKTQLAERITSQIGDEKQDDNWVVYSSGDGGPQKRYTGSNSGRYDKDKYKHWDQYIVKAWSGDGADGDDEDQGSSSGSGEPDRNTGPRGDDDDIYIDNNSPWNNNNNRRPKQPRTDETVGGKDPYRDSSGASSVQSVVFSTLVLLTFTLWLNG